MARMAFWLGNRLLCPIPGLRTTQKPRFGVASECVRTAKPRRVLNSWHRRWSGHCRLMGGGQDGEQMAPRTILVVEDDPDIAQLVHLHLRDTGYDVDVAQDGQAGLQQALAGSYDLIILDLMLPGMNGLELCRKLRASSKCSLVTKTSAAS